MWNRAESYVKLSVNIINSYSKEYIPIETLESYEQVLKEIPQEFILYQNYKIVQFLSIVRNLEIKNLTTLWMKDEFREICFFGVVNFEFEEKMMREGNIGENESIRHLVDKPFN